MEQEAIKKQGYIGAGYDVVSIDGRVLGTAELAAMEQSSVKAYCNRNESGYSRVYHKIFDVWGGTIKPNGITVYMFLVRSQNSRTGECFPSLSLICTKTGIKSSRTVSKVLITLEQAGLIRIFSGKKSHKPNRYLIAYPIPRNENANNETLSANEHEQSVRSASPDKWQDDAQEMRTKETNINKQTINLKKQKEDAQNGDLYTEALNGTQLETDNNPNFEEVFSVNQNTVPIMEEELEDKGNVRLGYDTQECIEPIRTQLLNDAPTGPGNSGVPAALTEDGPGYNECKLTVQKVKEKNAADYGTGS